MTFDRTISPKDHMGIGNEAAYFRVTETAVAAIRQALLTAQVSAQDIQSALDFGCGYGRIYRAFPEVFPNARLTAADLMEEATEFVTTTFGGRGVSSTMTFDCDLGDQFDFVWMGSVVTHLPALAWQALFDHLARHMGAGGLIVFSAHGARSLVQMERGPLARNPHLIEAEVFQEIKRRLDEVGFMFAGVRPGNLRHQREVLKMDVTAENYGFSFATAQWVKEFVSDHAAFDLVSHAAGAWGGHDIVTIRRTEVAA